MPVEPLSFIVTSLAIFLAAGYYWGQDQYPLAAVKFPALAWLFRRGTFLQTVGSGLDCGVCTGQWLAFALTWALYVSPLDDPVMFATLAVGLNFANWALTNGAYLLGVFSDEGE